MKHDVEMGSGAMIYIPIFIKIGSSIQKFIRGDSQTHSMVISYDYFCFFKNKENRPKM
jgi:hypothetical protein